MLFAAEALPPSTLNSWLLMWHNPTIHTFSPPHLQVAKRPCWFKQIINSCLPVKQASERCSFSYINWRFSNCSPWASSFGKYHRQRDIWSDLWTLTGRSRLSYGGENELFDGVAVQTPKGRKTLRRFRQRRKTKKNFQGRRARCVVATLARSMYTSVLLHIAQYNHFTVLLLHPGL